MITAVCLLSIGSMISGCGSGSGPDVAAVAATGGSSGAYASALTATGGSGALDVSLLTASGATSIAPLARVQLGELAGDGPNWTLASTSLKYAWVHPGGDYLDSAGTPNGPAHYAQASISTYTGAVSWDVTAIVRKLQSEQNTGIYLKKTSTGKDPKIGSRLSATPPALHVVTDAGTFNLPLASGCWISASSNKCLGSDPSDPRLSFPALLKFDLSQVQGTVSSATLKVTLANVYTVPITISADYLDMPPLITDPARQLGGVEGGIAASVENDGDLRANPAVLWYPRMDTPVNIKADWSWLSPSYPSGWGVINPKFVDWSEYGLTALRMESQSLGNVMPGDSGSSILTWREYINAATRQVSGVKTIGSTSRDELYVRYMLKIDPDVSAGMNELGVKLPGFEGSGFSARMEHTAASKANPDVFRLLIYWYGASTPFNDPNRGGMRYTNVSLRAGQIYSIEQRIKQNTRNADETWNADGALEIWVDGVKVFSDTAMLINNTVWPAEINNFFANFYHGGNGTPIAPIHYEFGGIAVSTSYIGPARKIGAAQCTTSPDADPALAPCPTLPAWIPAPGTSSNVSLNTMADVDPCPARNCPYSGSIGQAGVLAWSGGVFASGLGTYGSMIFTGGGRSDYYGNEVYRYDLETRLFSRMTEPYTNLIAKDGYFGSGYGSGSTDNFYGEYWADGTFTGTLPTQPLSAHMYDQTLYLPPGLGGAGAAGAIVTVLRDGAPPTGQRIGTMTHILDLANPTWRRFATNVIPRANRGSADVFPSLGKIFHGGAGPANKLNVLDTSTKTWSQLQLSEHTLQYEPGIFRALPSLGLLMYYRTNTFYLVNPTTGQVYRPGTTGTGPAQSGGGAWADSLGKFVYYEGKGGSTVFSLTPSANPTVDPWVWTSETVTGPTPVSTGDIAHYSRLRWVPQLRVFLWLAQTNSQMQVWRLQGT